MGWKEKREIGVVIVIMQIMRVLKSLVIGNIVRKDVNHLMLNTNVCALGCCSSLISCCSLFTIAAVHYKILRFGINRDWVSEVLRALHLR